MAAEEERLKLVRIAKLERDLETLKLEVRSAFENGAQQYALVRSGQRGLEKRPNIFVAADRSTGLV